MLTAKALLARKTCDVREGTWTLNDIKGVGDIDRDVIEDTVNPRGSQFA
jgi:hypothetical protein